LGIDSFGLNLFSDTSDGKTLVLYVAASVDGLIGPDGLPGWADSEPGMEHQSHGHRDGLMPRDETADGDRGGDTLKTKTRMVGFQVLEIALGRFPGNTSGITDYWA
jgi:uncharacterized protein (DUF927 family)